MSEHKTTGSRKGRTRRSERNEWLASDQAERNKSIAAIAIVVIVLGLGLWLIVRGFSG